MNKDLRSFLHQLQTHRPDDLVRVTQPVPADQGPAALLHRLESLGRSPVIQFDCVGEIFGETFGGVSGGTSGGGGRFVVNCHGTPYRLALALEVSVQELHQAYADRLQCPIRPVAVDTGPVKQVVIPAERIDIRTFPVIRPSVNCPGPYIGGGILVANDPATGIANLSFNRLMIQGPKHLGFHAAPGLHLHTLCDHAEQRREELPVAIIIGYHPAFALGTLAKIPLDADEYEYASAMLQQPVPLVRCESNALRVPANAEIILEGKVLLDVRRPEGPYDEFTGYAMAQQMQPVIELTAITHRRDAIFQDIFGGSAEHLLLGSIPKEASLLAKLKENFPFVRNIHLPHSGGGRLHATIAVNACGTDDVQDLFRAAFAIDHFLKHVFVVNEDVDIHNDRQVLQAMSTCFQGDRDMMVLKNMLGSSLDPSASTSDSGVGTKIGFDCTRKKDDFPLANRIDSTILNKMNPDDYITTNAHGPR